jgi:hypothetical protein
VLLSRLQLAGVGGLDLVASFLDASGAPRRLTVIFGGEGVGKTAALSAIASTRPGHAVALGPAPAGDGPAPCAVADWLLGDDDPARPHPLKVVSPNARLEGERDDAALARRREQAHFDKRAQEAGFVACAISGARWFSRTPVLLSAPERGLLRWDPRAAAVFDDPARADLTRETRQILAYAGIGAALGRGRPEGARLARLDRALREALEVILEDTDAAYLDVSPTRLEPIFSLGGREVDLDDLPRSVRHRVALVTIPLRALGAAYPDREPRAAEGVVLVDDLEVELDPRAQEALPARLARALPRAQWIVTTASRAVALGAELDQVMALRRSPASGEIELHGGPTAVLH